MNPSVASLVPGPASQPFRIVAYLMDDAVLPPLPFEKLTHLNYSFLIPNSDGTFQSFVGSDRLKTVVSAAHNQNVKVLISVGGWGWEAEFESVAASPEKRTVFVDGLLKFMQDYALDGTDIDWEYPQAGQSAQNFLALMTELRAALPKEKLLTTAVVVSGKNAEAIPAETFARLDFINIMAYDEPGHGTLEQFNQGLEYWQERGVSKEKLVIGAPFYSRPGEIPYKKLIELDPAAAQTDALIIDGVKQNYNGLPTIQHKTRLALEKASGIMFWNLLHDTTGDLSLVNAIYQTVVRHKS